jgi:hypothetical protein
MPISNILVSPWGQKLRSYLKSGAHDQYVIPTTPRVVSAQVMVSTFRIAGSGVCEPQPVLRAECRRLDGADGSPSYVAASRSQRRGHDGFALCLYLQDYLVLTDRRHCLTKHLFDSNDSSSASCTATGAASAEGTASAITWTAPSGTPAWRQYIMRMHTLVGQVIYPDESLIPLLTDTDPVILRAGQALVVQINIASSTGTHYTINCMWEEFTLP